jgi:membrane-bound ClpP family serine protease
LTDAIVGPSALLVALKTLPRTKVGKRMILSGPEPEQVKNAATDESLGRLLGKSGIALTDLRPAGYARIEGRRIDVVARGSALPKDTAVCVVAVEQNRVVVARDAAGTTQHSKT